MGDMCHLQEGKIHPPKPNVECIGLAKVGTGACPHCHALLSQLLSRFLPTDEDQWLLHMHTVSCQS